jgi:hypothetical protein
MGIGDWAQSPLNNKKNKNLILKIYHKSYSK